MRRTLAVGPVLLLLAWWTYTTYQRFRIDAALPDPDGLVWRSNQGSLTVRASIETDGTLSRHAIRIVRDDGSVAHEDRFDVDWDAGLTGGGFVRAVQADDDPELEIAAWAANFDRADLTRVPFLLDHSEGSILRRPFDEASATARQLASRWLHAHVVRGLELTAVVILLVVYYVLFAVVIGALRLWRRLKKPPSSA